MQVLIDIQLVRHRLLKYVLSVIPRGIELLQGVAESQRAETQVLGAPHLPRLIEAHLHGAEAHFDDRRALLHEGLKALAARSQCFQDEHALLGVREYLHIEPGAGLNLIQHNGAVGRLPQGGSRNRAVGRATVLGNNARKVL